MKPLLFFFTLLTGSLLAQPLDSLSGKSQRIDLQSVDLIQVRASKRSPMAVTRLDAASIKAADHGQGLPFVLQFQPSLLQSSDAGNGMGYTYLRMRGMDQTRINVTINGVALNDPEGHGVFWVNTPDLTSSLNSIQIQRGVGTSTAGPGAFGGSLSLEVGQPDKEASQSITLGGGSFLSARTTYAWQSGEMPQGKGSLRFMGRMSHMQSEGFVDRSSSKLNSYLFAMAYREGNQSIRYVHFNGHEVSQQAWWGIPMVKWRGDQAGVEAYILNNYLANDAADHLRESGNTTYNYYRYPNEIDNYRQSHHQLIATKALDNDWTLNMTSYLVTGKGYFEQWKANQDYAAYGLANPIVEGNAVTSTNLVRQRWLDNLSVGTNISLSKQVGDWKTVMGYAWQGFIGEHYGTLPWMAINPLQGVGAMDYRYYESYGDKTDNMTFIKVELPMFDGDWLAYGDLQLRHISYDIYGLDADRVDLNGMDSKRFTFFNPKVGMDRQWANNSRSYLSMAVANREPTRGDFIASMQLEEPRAERLMDWEIGHHATIGKGKWEVNAYHMAYQDQLVPTGALNDVGALIRTNVASSYRQGIELMAIYKVTQVALVGFNGTFSRNRIADFEEELFDYVSGQAVINHYLNSPIAMSPEGMLNAYVLVDAKPLSLRVDWQAVSKQYLDNTGSDERALDPYQTLNLTATWHINTTQSLSLNLRNVGNVTYAPNGYTWGYYLAGQRSDENFVYPMAGRHGMLTYRVTF